MTMTFFTVFYYAAEFEIVRAGLFLFDFDFSIRSVGFECFYQEFIERKSAFRIRQLRPEFIEIFRLIRIKPARRLQVLPRFDGFKITAFCLVLIA